MQSKPGPMLAIEAGTLTLIWCLGAGASAPQAPCRLGRDGARRLGDGTLQLQDLSECARISVQLDGRLDVLERGVGVLEPRAGQDDDHCRVLVDLAFADEGEQQR